MVLGTAVLLVVGVARLLGGGGHDPDATGDGRARAVADTSSQAGEPSSAPASGKPRHHRTTSPTDDVTPVAMPSGPCQARDVAVTPSVPHPVGGRDIQIVLDLSSLTTPACTWTLSAATLAMRITSGSDPIWTTAQCSRSIPSQDLVLRQDQPTRARITWDARRSEPGCPVETAWALPGTYHLEVAALGGQPQDVTFVLTPPDHSASTPSGGDGTQDKGTRHKKKHHRHHTQPPPG
jgi:hypothetical protein